MKRLGQDGMRAYFVEPLVFRCSFQNAFNDAFELINGGGLLGICENCGLVTSDH